MYRVNNNIIDAVSANQLLKALNTLHIINQTQPQHATTHKHQTNLANAIAIANHNHSFSLEHNLHTQQQPKQISSNVIDFDLYMQKKNHNKPAKPHLQTNRKSISPLKEITQTHDALANVKSRSHSPLFKKADKSILKKDKLAVLGQVDRKVLKQIKKQNIVKNHDISYQASFQSKKILDQKQRKGVAYVPIQFRTQQLMKEKQMKIAKLQKQKQITQILKEKEYTFKPTLIKSKKIRADSKYLQNIQNREPTQDPKKPKAQHCEPSKASKQNDYYERQLKRIQCFSQQKRQQRQRQSKISDSHQMQPILQLQQTIRYENSCEQNQFLNVQTINLRHQNESTEYLFPTYKGEEFKPKKYKNQKFNFLLDLIH